MGETERTIARKGIKRNDRRRTRGRDDGTRIRRNRKKARRTLGTEDRETPWINGKGSEINSKEGTIEGEEGRKVEREGARRREKIAGRKERKRARAEIVGRVEQLAGHVARRSPQGSPADA